MLIFSKLKKFKAFTLIESALMIAIIGIAISFVFPILKTIYISKKNKINEEKYMQIRIAMQAYLLRHGYLPHAANENGEEEIEKYKGYVPYKTLGINKKYAFDANGKNFIYAVNKYLTKQNGKIHIPITTPASVIPQFGMISFGRLYEYDAAGKIIKMDNFPDDHLKIIENGVSIINENDFFYVMRPLRKFDRCDEYKQWLTDSISPAKREEKYKTRNGVAWALFSNNVRYDDLQNECTFYITTEKKIFYQNQSRFDMLAQVGFPATPEPMYEE